MGLLTQNQRDYINALMKRADPCWQGRFTAEHAEKYGLSEREVRWGFTTGEASALIDMLKFGNHLGSHQAEELREQRQAAILLSEWEPRRPDTTVHNVGYGVARPNHLNNALPKQKDYD